LLSWLIGLPLATVVVLFALSNRQGVLVALWPFEEVLSLPLFAVALVPLIVGFAAGALFGGVRVLRHRRAARSLAKRAAQLEREVEGLRQADAGSAAPAAAGTPSLPS
jgi:uncharacterized integral membrane protein